MSQACPERGGAAPAWERLETRHAALAERVRCADASALEIVESRRGARTLRQAGVQLASPYDPNREAEQVVAGVESGADLVVLVGLGLGHAVEVLLARGVRQVLVFEPDPARLRAALELRPDAAWVEDERVHWASQPEEAAELFTSLYAPGLSSTACVWPPIQRLEPDVVRDVLRLVAQRKRVRDVNTMTHLKMGALWAHISAENASALASTPGFSNLEGLFRGRAAVVAAAGPSLDQQLPLLAEYADRLVIIAIGQTLSALRAAGIEPDLVHVLESQDVSHQIVRAGDLTRVALVLAPSAHPALFALPVGARFAAYPSTNPLGRWIGEALGEDQVHGGGATVAQSAVRLAAGLGCDRIALVGQDLAFTGGRIYGAGTAYDMLELEERDGQLLYTRVQEKTALFEGVEAPDEIPVDTVWVEGWDGQPVATSHAYATFIEGYRLMGSELATEGVRLVNCTEGGARIPELEHARLRDFLAERPLSQLAAGEVVRRVARETPVAEPGLPARLAGRAHAALDRLDRLARRGLDRTRTARRTSAGSQRKQVEVLKSVARAQKAMRKATGSLPWLDVFVQAELCSHGLELHRQEAGGGPAEALDEAQVLFETTRKAVARARQVAERLASGGGDPDETPDTREATRGG